MDCMHYRCQWYQEQEQMLTDGDIHRSIAAATAAAAHSSRIAYATRRALPTKSIHSNAVPEGIWRGTSYYLVERSQPCRIQINRATNHRFGYAQGRRHHGGRTTVGHHRAMPAAECNMIGRPKSRTEAILFHEHTSDTGNATMGTVYRHATMMPTYTQGQ